MKSVRQTVWKTADGQVFADKKDAAYHEAELTLVRLMEEESVGQGCNWSPDMIRNWMVYAGWPLINALSDLARRGPRS